MFGTDGEPMRPPGIGDLSEEGGEETEPTNNYSAVTPPYALGSTHDAEIIMKERIDAACGDFIEAAKRVGFSEPQYKWIGELLRSRDKTAANMKSDQMKLEEKVKFTRASAHSEGDKVQDKRAPEAFTGEKFATYEWQMMAYLDDQFKDQGTQYLKWASKQTKEVTAEFLNENFGSGWKSLDKELYRQLTRITTEKAHNIIRAATIMARTGANIWRSIKEDYDRESLLQLDMLRSEIVDRPAQAK